MNESESREMIEAVGKACEFLASLASDLKAPQLWQLIPEPKSGKTHKGVVIALTGTEEEVQMAVDFVHNLVQRRRQQAIAANN